MSIPVYPIRILEYAISDAVAKLGIGGYIPARDIVKAFNPISAGEFAQIMYATDLMSEIFDDEQAVNVDNVKTIVEQNRFETRDCFNDLIEVFRAHFKRLDHVQFQ